MSQPEDTLAAQSESEAGTVEFRRRELENERTRLQRFANRGLWASSLFLLVCMVAWRDFPFLPLPDSVVASLGPAPSSSVISTVLLLYTFSAIILSLSRLMGNIEHKSSFTHVGYLAGFFIFFHFSKALDDNYWAVFGAGVTILGLESYRIWTYCTEKITRLNEQLAFIDRTGRMPLDD